MSQTLPVGGILRDRYEIIDLVGQGGMGAVYKADDLRLRGRICAVKEILPELISVPGMEDQAHDSSTVRRASCPASTTPTCPRSPISSPNDYGPASIW